MIKFRSGIFISAMAVAMAAVTVAAVPAAARARADQVSAGYLAAASAGHGRDGLAGVWRTDGYGMIVTVGSRHGYVYQTTATSCMFVQRADRIGVPGPGHVQRFGVDGVVTTLAWPTAGGRGWIHPLGSAGNIGMRRIARLPARCLRPTSADPVTSYGIFWRTFTENYPFFATQKINWPAIVARYRARVNAGTSPGELFNVFVAMVRPLHNAHIDVISADDTRAFEGLRPHTRPWSAAFCARAERVTGRRLHARLRTWGDGNIAYASLAGHVGYLRIAAFEAYAGEGSTFHTDTALLRRALDSVFTPARTRSL